MAEPNHYKTLGIDKNATESEIKNAFRKLVRKYHPDVNDAPDADNKVAELNIAYETLTNSAERAKYDAVHSPFGVLSHGFKQSFKNGFEEFSQHSSANRSRDNAKKEPFDRVTSQEYWDGLNTHAHKNWEELKEKLGEKSPFGSSSFNFDDLVSSFKKNANNGGFNNKSSAKKWASSSSKQKDAHQTTNTFKEFDKFSDLFANESTGSSQFEQSSPSNFFSQSLNNNDSKNSVRGADQQTEISIDLSSTYTGDDYNVKLNVPVYDTHGEISHEAESLKIRIPKGITEGKKIRLPKKGSASLVGGKNGDFFLKVVIKHDDHIRLDGADVYQTVNIAPWEALLGANIIVNTPAGEVEVTIPASSKSGNTLTLSKKGIPAKKCGNLYLVFNITNPKVQQPSQRLAYEKLRDAFKNVEIER